MGGDKVCEGIPRLQVISCDKGSSSALCLSEKCSFTKVNSAFSACDKSPNLTPSDKKLGRGVLDALGDN